MSRKLCITSADGQTGHLVAELILTDETFSSKIAELTCLSLHPEKCEDLVELGAKVVPHKPGDQKGLAAALKKSGADTIFLIPPAHKDKVKLSEEMLMATREAGVKNTVLLSSAAVDLAEDDAQPRLREFIKIESLFMESKGLTTTESGHSPCIIRAGFYAENLLLYNKDAQKNGKLRLPIGPTHKFAPVALGDIAQIAAHVLTGEGPQGLDDKHRGQMITMTGPMLTSGNELAAAAKQAGLHLEFDDISPKEAKDILDADTDVDDSEKDYLLEYYSLVREGRTNYVSTLAFYAIVGEQPMEPSEFFKTYDAEFKSKRRRIRK